MDASLALRPATSEDDEFLFGLFRSAREAEFAALPGGDAVLEPLLRIQFRAQRLQYETAFPQAAHMIVLEQGRPAGRLLVDRSGTAFRLVDIALLPSLRNRGIGSVLIRDLMAQAAAADRPLALQVWKDNPAARLYRRLGFQVVAGGETYVQMEWRSGG